MGGGIIINRAAVLLSAALDVSIYDFLSVNDKDAVEQIAAKAPSDRTEDDVRFLAEKIREVICS